MFYVQDSATGKQTSLRTKDETEAKSLLEARNHRLVTGWAYSNPMWWSAKTI